MTPWYLSKTTWALIVGGLASLGTFAGFNIGKDQITTIAQAAVDISGAIAVLAPIVAGVLHSRTKTGLKAIIDQQAQAQNGQQQK